MNMIMNLILNNDEYDIARNPQTTSERYARYQQGKWAVLEVYEDGQPMGVHWFKKKTRTHLTKEGEENYLKKLKEKING